jgi:hypothetical protein
VGLNEIYPGGMVPEHKHDTPAQPPEVVILLLIFERPVATGFLVVAFVFILAKIYYQVFYRKHTRDA